MAADTFECKAQQFASTNGWVPKAVSIDVDGSRAEVRSKTVGRSPALGVYFKDGNRFKKPGVKATTSGGSVYTVEYSIRFDDDDEIYFGYQLRNAHDQSKGFTMQCEKTRDSISESNNITTGNQKGSSSEESDTNSYKIKEKNVLGNGNLECVYQNSSGVNITFSDVTSCPDSVVR